MRSPPRHDPLPGRRRGGFDSVLTRILRGRRSPPGDDASQPVRPDRPLDLSGGAGAALPLD